MAITYAVEQRLRFIDFLLHQYGSVNRSAIMDYYGVSMPQASNDLKQYMELAPANMRYHGSRKCYVKTLQFKRHWE